MNKKIISMALSVLMAGTLAFTGCAPKNSESSENKVFATIAPMYDFTRKIAGDKFDVELLVKGDIHDYEPSAAEMAKLEKSKMVVYNGLSIDSFVNSISANTNVVMVNTSEKVTVMDYEDDAEHYVGDGHDHTGDNLTHSVDDGHGHTEHYVGDGHDHTGDNLTHSVDDGHGHTEHYVGDGHDHTGDNLTHSVDDGHGHAEHYVGDGHDHTGDNLTHSVDDGHGHAEHYVGDGHDHSSDSSDPHIWLYPLNAKIQMSIIRDALVKADSANTDYYNANFDTYAKKCDELDSKFKALKGKTIVTTHGAYGYWEKMYGIEVIAMDTAGTEISPAKMKEIVDYCKQKGITTIYYEEGGSDKTAQAVAKEIGGQVKALNSFETAVNGKDDYFTIMEQNYEALK